MNPERIVMRAAALGAIALAVLLNAEAYPSEFKGLCESALRFLPFQR